MTSTFQPKLVALDVDGTLVDYSGVMPGSVKQAVARVVAAGVPVVVTTGRGWSGTQGIVEMLQLPHGYHVCSNGAVVCSYAPFRVEQAVTFDPTQIIAEVRREQPSAAIAVEDIGQGYRVSRKFPDGELAGYQREVSIEDLCSHPVSRVVVRDEDATEAEFIELAERLGLHSLSYFIGYTAWLDIAPKGIDKAYGLSHVCQRLGVNQADVLAIGDGSNDVDMLRWAGRGVALGQGNELAKDAADHITDDFDDDGTANELNRWFA